MKKDERFRDCIIELKKMVDENSFGSIQFHFQEGFCVNFKKELTGRFLDTKQESE